MVSLTTRAGFDGNSGKLPPVQRRILLLITDLRIGGTPTVVRELAVRLHGDPDFHVHVACLDRWGPVADQLRNGGVPVTTLNACCSVDPRVLAKLVWLIRQEEIDTVFVTLEPAGRPFAAPTGKPILEAYFGTPPNHP